MLGAHKDNKAVPLPPTAPAPSIATPEGMGAAVPRGGQQEDDLGYTPPTYFEPRAGAGYVDVRGPQPQRASLGLLTPAEARVLALLLAGAAQAAEIMGSPPVEDPYTCPECGRDRLES